MVLSFHIRRIACFSGNGQVSYLVLYFLVTVNESGCSAVQMRAQWPGKLRPVVENIQVVETDLTSKDIVLIDCLSANHRGEARTLCTSDIDRSKS